MLVGGSVMRGRAGFFGHLSAKRHNYDLRGPGFKRTAELQRGRRSGQRRSDAEFTTPPNNGNTIVVTIPEQYSSWLNVSPSVIPSTPGQLSVSVNATSLGAGTQSGTFTVAVQNNAATAQTVTVSATITGTSALTASPAALSFIAQAGQNFGTPQNCAVQNSASTCQDTILSSAGTLAYNVSMTPANSWLLTDQFSGSTGGVPMNVGVNASILTPGTYTGQIQVQSKTTSDSVTIAVTLTVTANATLSAAPTSLTFYYTIGSTTPAAQQVTVSSSGAAVAFTSPSRPIPAGCM